MRLATGTAPRTLTLLCGVKPMSIVVAKLVPAIIVATIVANVVMSVFGNMLDMVRFAS